MVISTGHDWLDVLGILATVAAAGLAAFALIQTRRESRRAGEALIRERRIDFELGLLKEMTETLMRGQIAAVLPQLALLPAVEFQAARALVGSADANPAALAELTAANQAYNAANAAGQPLAKSVAQVYTERTLAEVRAAVTRRLGER